MTMCNLKHGLENIKFAMQVEWKQEEALDQGPSGQVVEEMDAIWEPRYVQDAGGPEIVKAIVIATVIRLPPDLDGK
jgi:hypothetical protein